MPVAASIIIPTYNRRDSLRRTLDGLSRQDFADLDRCEVLVISDGSTDGTHEMLEEYAARDNGYQLRIFHQKNQGPSRARNRGILEARGEVVVFIDDDVVPVPEFLETHLKHHRANANVAVIGPLSPDPENRPHEPVWIAWEHAMLEKQYTCFRTGEWLGAGPNHFYSGNASVRREHLLAVNGFDESFTRQEDVEMAYRLESQRGVRFVFEAAAIGRHRPLRTLESWLKVPYAYGRLDVVRAQRGDTSWYTVEHGYSQRNRITRVLMWLALTAPPLAPALRGVLIAAAKSLYRLRRDAPAYGLLSAVFNMRYMEGVQDEIADNRVLRRIVRGEYPAA